MLRIIKKLLQSAITSDAGMRLLAPFLPTSVNILFLHRFAMPDLGVQGHDPAALRAHLEYLRRHGYQLIDLRTLLAQMDAGSPITKPGVVFTVDDGYADFPAIAAPVFAEYDCPVTVFLITDFVAGKLWNWFDRVPWLLAQTARREVLVGPAAREERAKWKDDIERAAVAEKIVESLKRISDTEKEEAIVRLAVSLEVELPQQVPERDRAMTWAQVRECARRGASFGPHTVTHPILSQVNATRSAWEINESWRHVQTETDAAVPVFCYPNGTLADFSSREKQSVAQSGMTGALSTIQASIVSPGGSRARVDRFAMPRFSYPETRAELTQIVSGLEALRGLRVAG